MLSLSLNMKDIQYPIIKIDDKLMNFYLDSETQEEKMHRIKIFFTEKILNFLNVLQFDFIQWCNCIDHEDLTATMAPLYHPCCRIRQRFAVEFSEFLNKQTEERRKEIDDVLDSLDHEQLTNVLITMTNETKDLIKKKYSKYIMAVKKIM